MTDFREAFPDLNFWGTADHIAEGDYVVGRREGGGTHNVRRSTISSLDRADYDLPENALQRHDRAPAQRRQVR
ncbi:hypothetical protein PQR32_14315 [Paraburkholderia dipogonis]